jgi:hypothetical protein
MVPTYGWPEGSLINPNQLPDWSWRVEPVYDIRADAARPEGAQPLAIDTAAGVTPTWKRLLDQKAAAVTGERTLRQFLETL